MCLVATSNSQKFFCSALLSIHKEVYQDLLQLSILAGKSKLTSFASRRCTMLLSAYCCVHKESYQEILSSLNLAISTCLDSVPRLDSDLASARVLPDNCSCAGLSCQQSLVISTTIYRLLRVTASRSVHVKSKVELHTLLIISKFLAK